jgi:hypothetical protein
VLSLPFCCCAAAIERQTVVHELAPSQEPLRDER